MHQLKFNCMTFTEKIILSDDFSLLEIRSGSKKGAHIQKLAICIKIHIFCVILMKLGENS